MLFDDTYQTIRSVCRSYISRSAAASFWVMHFPIRTEGEIKEIITRLKA
jgi:hypothetical protein